MKLIQTKDYLLLIDNEAEIKEGNIAIHDFGMGYVLEIPCDKDNLKSNTRKLVVAYHPLTKEVKELDLPLLPIPFKKTNIEKLAIQDLSEDGEDGISNYDIKNWIKGYKAAQSKTSFTLEDVEKAIEMAREIKDNGDIFDIDSIRGLTEVCTYDWEERYSDDEIIQSLSTQQLPKQFIPEYRYYYHSSKEFYSDAGFVECSKEQYESIKVEIPTCPLKAEIRTITNPGGKEEIVGTYKY